MAAVTLKDLMDPLTKIQAATESTAESLDALTTAVVASGQVGDGIQSAILAELQLQTQLMRKARWWRSFCFIWWRWCRWWF